MAKSKQLVAWIGHANWAYCIMVYDWPTNEQEQESEPVLKSSRERTNHHSCCRQTSQKWNPRSRSPRRSSLITTRMTLKPPLPQLPLLLQLMSRLTLPTKRLRSRSRCNFRPAVSKNHDSCANGSLFAMVSSGVLMPVSTHPASEISSSNPSCFRLCATVASSTHPKVAKRNANISRISATHLTIQRHIPQCSTPRMKHIYAFISRTHLLLPS